MQALKDVDNRVIVVVVRGVDTEMVHQGVVTLHTDKWPGSLRCRGVVTTGGTGGVINSKKHQVVLSRVSRKA